MTGELDLSKLPIDAICPIMDTGKGVVLQLSTEHVSQIYLSYEKWKEYVEHVNQRNSQIKPMQVINPIIVPEEKSWIWDRRKNESN